jgi:hypothetical protein
MMQTVYDNDGNAYTVDSVDAREYVSMGAYFHSKPEPKPAEIKPEVAVKESQKIKSAK